MRTSVINRKTAETDISLSLNLDGTGKRNIHSGNGFFDHMLTLFASHGRFDIDLVCNGDTDVDFHHSAEDIGICLGKAFKEALGDNRGITRYGFMAVPMDEAMILCAVDISGRPYLVFNIKLASQQVGQFDTELVKEFFTAFASNAGVTIHFKETSGENTHHIIEASFKAFARAMKIAVKINEEIKDEIPSSKGVL